MTFRLGILGGGLQGIEAAYLAKLAGWQTVLADGRSAPPASGLADKFVSRRIKTLQDLDQAFSGCDLVLPAFEDLPTLELLAQWSANSGQPLAFDLPSYRISSDKSLSRDLFLKSGTPIPRPWPEAEYPMIAKPVASSGSRGVCLLENEADFKKLFPDKNISGWIVEEYCPGPSFSLEVTGRPGAHQSWLTTALEMDEIYDCRQVHAPAALSADEDKLFHKISLNIARHLGLTGLMDVEIILAPQGIRVLEIDARLPSQTPAVVYWASGENLLCRLAENFIAQPPVPPAPPHPRAVIFEHVSVADAIKWPGEHVMAEAGPLKLQENFFGADWALTDQRPGCDHWAATLIMIADDEQSVLEKRNEVISQLKAGYGKL